MTTEELIKLAKQASDKNKITIQANRTALERSRKILKTFKSL